MTRTPHPQSDSREPMSGQQKAVLAVLLVPTFASLLSVSSVNVLLAVIQDTLDASASDLQWVIAAYSLVFGVLLVAAGRGRARTRPRLRPGPGALRPGLAGLRPVGLYRRPQPLARRHGGGGRTVQPSGDRHDPAGLPRPHARARLRLVRRGRRRERRARAPHERGPAPAPGGRRRLARQLRRQHPDRRGRGPGRPQGAARPYRPRHSR